jgi:hypothetical protein
MALKRELPDGSWVDLVSRRPRYPYHGPDSAGPLLRTSRGTAVFRTNRIRARDGGVLVASGGYYRLRGRPSISRSSDVRYRPVECGVQVSFPVRRGDRAEYSVFLRDRNSHRGSGFVRSGGTTVSFDPRARVLLGRGSISSLDARVLRVRLRWTGRKSGRVRVTICGSS